MFRDRKLTQLLRESLGGATCNTCAIIHLSPVFASYSDTLQALQLASRMHQTRLRRRSKVSQCVTYLLFLCVINWLVISTTTCGNIATKQPATLRIAIRIVHSCMKFTVKWVRRKNIRICKTIDIDVKFIACKLCSLYFANDVGLVTVN